MKIKYLVFALLAVLAAVIICLTLFGGGDGKKTAYVYSGGVLVHVISLREGDREIRLEAGDGYNVISVSEGKIGVIEADCPDKTCIRTGFTDNSFVPVICMPNRLEIVVKSEDTETDGVAR